MLWIIEIGNLILKLIRKRLCVIVCQDLYIINFNGICTVGPFGFRHICLCALVQNIHVTSVLLRFNSFLV